MSFGILRDNIPATQQQSAKKFVLNNSNDQMLLNYMTGGNFGFDGFNSFTANQRSIRTFNGALNIIKTSPLSRHPIIYDILYSTNGLIEKIVDLNINRAFLKPPTINASKKNKINKSNKEIPSEIIDVTQEYITTGSVRQVQSIYFETVNAIKMAQRTGGAFLVLCVDKEGDNLQKSISLNPKDLHKSKLGGNVYFESVNLAYNNRMDVADVLKLYDFASYDVFTGNTAADPKNPFVQDLQWNATQLVGGAGNYVSSKDHVYLYIGRTMQKVHKSRVFPLQSTNTPRGILLFRMFGFGYSVVEKSIDTIINIQTMTDSLTDLVKRASMLFFEQTNTEAITNNTISTSTIKKLEENMNFIASTNWDREIALVPAGYAMRQVSGSFSGVMEASERLENALAMQNNISLQDLKGESTSGFSSGEDIREQSVYAVENLREHFRPFVSNIFRIVFANQVNVEQYGYDDLQAIDLSYDSPRQETKDQELARKSKQYEIARDLFDKGIIDSNKFIDIVNESTLLPSGIEVIEDTELSSKDKQEIMSRFERDAGI